MFALNTEMGVLIESPELAGALGEGFDESIMHKACKLELITHKPEHNQSGNEKSRLE